RHEPSRVRGSNTDSSRNTRPVRTSERRAHRRCDRAFSRLKLAEFGECGVSKIDSIRLRYGVEQQARSVRPRPAPPLLGVLKSQLERLFSDDEFAEIVSHEEIG